MCSLTKHIKFGPSGESYRKREKSQQFYDLVEKDTRIGKLIKEDDGVFLFKRGSGD